MTIKQRFHLRSVPAVRIATQTYPDPAPGPDDSTVATQVDYSSPPKLCVEQVLEMRRLLDQGSSARDMARSFGVSMQTVYNIRDHRTWKHVLVEAIAETSE